MTHLHGDICLELTAVLGADWKRLSQQPALGSHSTGSAHGALGALLGLRASLGGLCSISCGDFGGGEKLSQRRASLPDAKAERAVPCAAVGLPASRADAALWLRSSHSFILGEAGSGLRAAGRDARGFCRSVCEERSGSEYPNMRGAALPAS